KRYVDRLDYPNDLEAELGARTRHQPGANRLAEVAHLEIEGLGRRDLRGEDVAGAVGKPVLAESLRVRQVDAAVEDAYRFGARVVVDDHLLRADDGRPPQLARREPRELDVGDRGGGELEVDERHVWDRRNHATAAEGGHVRRRLVKPVTQDREVV